MVDAQPGKRETWNPHLALYEEVIREFGRLGRVTVRGKSTLESLSKEDLLRIVARIGAERLAPDTFGAAEKLVAAAEQLRASLAAIDRASLSPVSAAKLSEVETQLAPTVRTVQAMTKVASCIARSSSRSLCRSPAARSR